MYSYKNTLCVLSLAIVTGIYSPVMAEDGFLPDIQQQGEISFVTGGVGDEETAAMKSESGDYNLQIMNSDRDGHFADHRHITISDAKHNEVLDADSGPLFYANLPKGRYTVDASSNHQNLTKKVTIGGNKPTVVHFIWK